MVKRTPVAAISWCQCRARMAGFWSSATARRETRRFFTLLSKPVKASHALTYHRQRPGISTRAFNRDEGAWSCSSGFNFSCICSSWHSCIYTHVVLPSIARLPCSVTFAKAMIITVRGRGLANSQLQVEVTYSSQFFKIHLFYPCFFSLPHFSTSKLHQIFWSIPSSPSSLASPLYPAPVCL